MKRLGVVLLALSLALPPVARTALPPLVAGAVVVLGAGEAEARRSSSSGSRSSGGYTRPSTSSRTPTAPRTPSVTAPRTSSSTSGGYTRPGQGSSTSSRTPSLSTTDRDVSRSAAGQSFERYRQAQEARRPDPATPLGSQTITFPRRDTGRETNTRDTGSSTRTSGSSIGGRNTGSPQPASGYSYTPPRYAAAAPSRFGLWDAAMLWLLLDQISQPDRGGQPDRAAFFHNHAGDPGVQQWRATADKLASENPDLAAKLTALDQAVAAQRGTPRDTSYLPPDIAVPQADTDEAEEEDEFFSWMLLLALLGFIAYVSLKRRSGRATAAGRSANASATTPATLPPDTGGRMPLGPLTTAFDMLKRKAGGETYRPDWFRVGMAVQIDPSPFLLLGPDTSLRAPPMRADVAAVSTVLGTSALLYRLYLAGENAGFVEVALDQQGQPQTARYFAPLDEVHPADDGEWDFWLAKKDGMIGWPNFETKDARTYDRVWQPGERRIQPLPFTETRERVDGSAQRDMQGMLYGRATGLADPAPATEYLWIAASDTGSEAWVELYLGIDLNPASLGLA